MIRGVIDKIAWGAGRCLSPEAAHRCAVYSLKYGLGVPPPIPVEDRLKTSCAGLGLPNPLGLAAGFDKDGEAIRGAFGLGFGLVEIGTITPRPQYGNPKPRVFRLRLDKAVINRYGFNNKGMEAVVGRLRRFRAVYRGSGILGVNIGANKDSADWAQEYYRGALGLARFADYLTVNVSSPNTVGLRGLQEAAALAEVLDATKHGMDAAQAIRPVFLKLAPDLTPAEVEAVLEVAVDKNCSGLIIANTTTHRPNTLKSPDQCEAGGLSGKPLFDPSTRLLAECHRRTPKGLALIAAGGVDSTATAYAKILLGANAVQLYTGLVFGGFGLPHRILAGLAHALENDGFANITQAVGTTHSVAEAYRISGITQYA